MGYDTFQFKGFCAIRLIKGMNRCHSIGLRFVELTFVALTHTFSILNENLELMSWSSRCVCVCFKDMTRDANFGPLLLNKQPPLTG